jgi:quinol monooxygenase YgiN
MKLISIILAIAVGGLAAAQNDDPLARIKGALKDPAKPFSMAVEFTLKPGSAAAVKSLIATAVQKTREEAGNLAYTCHQDAQNPDTLVFFELWASMKALEFHVTEPYTKAMIEKLTELSTEPMKVRVLYPFVPQPTLGKRPVVRPTPK